MDQSRSLSCGFEVLLCTQPKHTYLDGDDAGRNHAQLLRRAFREIDDSAPHKGTAIVDAYIDGARVLEVGNANDGAEGECLVGGGQLALSEALAGSGTLAVKAGAVPRGHASKHLPGIMRTPI